MNRFKQSQNMFEKINQSQRINNVFFLNTETYSFKQEKVDVHRS